MASALATMICRVFTINIVGSPLLTSTRAHGNCDDCCPVDESKDILFNLYTRESPNVPFALKLDNPFNLLRSKMSKQKPLVLYLHGFSEATTDDRWSGAQIKNAFLKSRNYDVVLVDWGTLVPAPWYANAVANVPVVGEYTARFIRHLIDKGYSADNIHVIGFSLGAIAAAYVGHRLKENGIELSRITGLDPALPLVQDYALNPQAAKFVDVIHTDGGFFGNLKASGHVDFYPNHGLPLQPGCISPVGCSHQRAWEYFVESVKWPKAFPAKSEQNKVAYMGLGVDIRARGSFYLKTNGESPYGKGLHKKA